MAEAAVLIGVQTALQVAQAALTLKSDIGNEVARQKAICDQIKDLNENQIPHLQALRGSLAKGQELSDESKTTLYNLSQSVNAIINNINDMEKDANQKLLMQVVISIVVIASAAIYIVNKKSSL